MAVFGTIEPCPHGNTRAGCVLCGGMRWPGVSWPWEYRPKEIKQMSANIAAISAILETLEPLDREAQNRVLAAVGAYVDSYRGDGGAKQSYRRGAIQSFKLELVEAAREQPPDIFDAVCDLAEATSKKLEAEIDAQEQR